VKNEKNPPKENRGGSNWNTKYEIRNTGF
jgi:hypothetical protein